jgi:hypothetical protein
MNAMAGAMQFSRGYIRVIPAAFYRYGTILSESLDLPSLGLIGTCVSVLIYSVYPSCRSHTRELECRLNLRRL